jgi:tripartite-type tricarboxylate transporter receptor subunit TctC
MRRRGLLAGALLGVAGGATAQEAWPARPVRLVIPFAPGGNNDVIARALGDRLQARLGQPFVAENRAGAGGAIGAQHVAGAPADGYVLLIASMSIVTIAATQRTGFDPAASFDAVARLAVAPLAVVVAPMLPARSIPELVALAKSRAQPLRYGSAGPGAINHLAGALFEQTAGIGMEHVPYRGIGPAAIDLIAGRIDLLITSPPAVGGPLRSGQIRLLATTGATRAAGFPEAPTVREAGYGYEIGFWWGILGPRGLPPQVRRVLEGAIGESLADPAFARFFEGEGATAAFLGGEEFGRIVAADLTRWRGVAAASGIRIE